MSEKYYQGAADYNEEPNHVYVIQTWDHMLRSDSSGAYHVIDYVHTSSSMEEALDFCRSYPTYAGNHNGWHWYISKVQVDYDYLDSVEQYHPEAFHYDRYGICECDNIGQTLADFEKKEESLYDAENKLFELIDEFSQDMKEIVEQGIEQLRSQLERSEKWLSKDHISEQ